jgi:hypothetical protein
MYIWDGAVDGSEGRWDSICEHKILFPSVSDIELKQLGLAGDMAYFYPDDPQYTKPTRWFRYEALKSFNGNYTASDCTGLSEITLYAKFGNGLTVNWVNLGGDLLEFFYTNEAGQPVSTIIPVTTQSSYIPDFGSVPLSYRTLYFTKVTVRDTVRAPLIDFTGTVYDLVHYIRSSPDGNIIKAADFDIGGEGIGFHDADNNNTSLNYRRERGDTRSDAVFLERGTAIGNQQKDGWYSYTVNVLDAGDYEIDFSVSAANTGGICRLYVDGEASADYSINNNGSWEDWRYYCDFNRLSPPKFYLSAGKHVIRVYVVATGWTLIRA